MRSWLLLFLIFLSAGCISKPMQKVPATEKTVVVEQGDVIIIDYVGRTSDTGELVSTSYESVATDPKEMKVEGFIEGGYGPINITIGLGVMPSIEKAATGMQAGEENDVLVPASEIVGERRPEFVRTIGRASILPIIEEVPVSSFQTVPKVGEKVNRRFWEATVIELTNISVAIRHEPVNGSNITMAFGQVSIILNDTHVLTTLTPKLGSFVSTPLGRAKIIDFDATTVTLDHNHPLAGRSLVYRIKVKEIIKPGG